MSLTKVSYSMISGEATNVLDKGADATGVSSSVAAFNAALLLGGNVVVPTGTYKLNGKVSFLTDNTTLWLSANVTLLLSGVVAQQTPWGNQLHVIADNCALIGSGPSSLLQITDGSQANAIGILHHSGFMVRDVTIDGDKANGTAIADDSFMTGISMVVDSGGGATADLQATIDNCIVQNFLQYGIQVYGNQANGSKIVNCNIRDIGKTGDAISVGGGIAVTRGVSDFIASNNVIKNCKLDGMFLSSAGLDCGNWTITGNVCHQNGGSGITFKESFAYSSVSNIGLFNVSVTGNTSTGNTRSGIQLDVNTLGYLKYFAITGNTCEGNTYGGIEVGSTNTTPNIVSNIQISGNLVLDNGTIQIGIGQYVETVQGYPQSFTPVIKGSVTAGVGTYSTQSGIYTNSNGIVYFELVLDWSAHTGSGDILVAGFPYAAKNAEPQSTSWVFANGLTITGQGVFGLSLNATQGPLGAVNNGSYSTVALDTAALLRITGFYFTT